MKYLKNVSDLLKLIQQSNVDEYRYFKSFIGLLIGLVTTLSFHLLTTSGLNFSDEFQILLTSLVGTFLCIGGVLTVKFRCIMLLMFPTFFGQSCRRLLIILLFTQLVQGPIQNIYVNLEEAVKSLTCVGNIAINMTLTRLELIYHPLHDILRALVVAGHDIESHMTSISGALYPLITMVEDDRFAQKQLDELKKIPGVEHLVNKVTTKVKHPKYNREETFFSETFSVKLRAHCLKLISGPIQICNKLDATIKVHYDNLGISFDGSCPPEIQTFCDDVESLGEEFETAYKSLKSLVGELDDVSDIDIEFDWKDAIEILDFNSAKYIKENLEDEIIYRVKIIEFMSKLLSRFLGLFFIVIFISAAKYQDKYLKKIDYDNKYVTSYFKRIDERRKKMGKASLLPLSSLEKLELINPRILKLLPKEKRRMMLSSTRIFPTVIIATVIFLLDAIIVYLLKLTAKYANLSFQATGKFEIHFDIHGNSSLANEWRDLFQTTNYSHSVNTNITNQECLPNASYCDIKYLLIILGIFMLLLQSSTLEAYGLRSRRFICSLCYYKREKIRVLWLYNSYLKKRIGSLESQKERLAKIAKWNENQKNSSLLLVIRESFPRCCNWLKFFTAANKRCLLCQALESETFVRCANCMNSYCQSCWEYLNETCIPCNFSKPDVEDENMRWDLTED